jgi:N,N'-diacetyllegionaminate synthase
MTAPRTDVVSIAGRAVGPGQPVFIVAELGVTFEGRFDVAAEMIAAAKAARVDAVKIECIDADRIIAPEYREKLVYSFKTLTGVQRDESYWELLKRLSLSYDDLKRLMSLARDAGVPIFGTAFDMETVGFLADNGSCAIKLSSGEITHHPLFEVAARSRLPVFFDTGRATLDEILRAKETLANHGAAAPIVMHNPAGYPAAPHDVNLGIIPLYANVLGCPVGLSCHSRGDTMVHAAVALGASVIEKPLSRDNTIEDDEHIFSVNMADLESYVREIRDLEAALRLDRGRVIMGSGDPGVRNKFRQSVVAIRALPVGHAITRSDVTFARPGYGIAPANVTTVIGRTVKTAIAAGALIRLEHLV